MSSQLAEAFPVGEFLAEELEARDWSRADFAAILGRPTQFVSEIITGKKEVTRESATQIGAALGTSPEYWLNLQNAYLLWKRGQDPEGRANIDDVRRRARLNELAPVSVLRKRGILRGGSLDELEAEILELFGLVDLKADPGFLAAARRTNRTQDVTPTQKAWLACARRAAAELPAAAFDREALMKLAAQVSCLVADPEGFKALQARYAEVGVRLVYVEALPGSRLDGAAFHADDGVPTIALSGRGHRLDKVLFVLLHETAHVALGHVTRDATFIDEGDDGEDPKERHADEQAVRWALPHGVSSPPAQVRAPWLHAEATRNRVHPVVVLGHLQARGALSWGSALSKGAPTVTHTLATWDSAVVPLHEVRSS